MIIVLNGPSSSGKTSIARELQELLPNYVLNFSIDSILYSLPPSALKRMTTGQKNPGLDYFKLEIGYYKCARVLADAGHSLVLDNAVITETAAKELYANFSELKLIVIGVICSTIELDRREKRRGDRTLGEAASQQATVHKYLKYDFTVDSSSSTPKEIAEEIIKKIGQT